MEKKFPKFVYFQIGTLVQTLIQVATKIQSTAQL